LRIDIVEGYDTKNPARYRIMEKREEIRKDFTPQFCIYFGIIILMINLITLLFTLLGIEMTGLILVIGYCMASILMIIIGLIFALIYHFSKKSLNHTTKSPFSAMYLLLGFVGIITNILIPVLVIISKSLLHS